MPSTLRAGESLKPGEELLSDNGQYRLVMQGDGNLVLYEPGNSPVWSTDTWRSINPIFRPITAELQNDGNFVLYSTTRWPAWATGTDGSGATNLVMQNDRNAVMYRPDGSPVWSTNTWIPTIEPPPPPPVGRPYPRPAQTPVEAFKRDEVGWGKFMETRATLYRDGRLVI